MMTFDSWELEEVKRKDFDPQLLTSAPNLSRPNRAKAA